MMMNRKHGSTLLLVAVLLLLVGRGGTAEVVVLKNGNMVAGTVKEVTETHVRIALQSGRATSRISFDEMTPESAFRIRERHAEQQTARDHLELGRFAREHHLFAKAREQYRKALSEAERPEVTKEAEEGLQKMDEEEAAYLLEKARRLEEQGALKEAVDTYQKIQIDFTDSEQAQKAGEEVERLSKQIAAQIKKEKEEQEKKRQQQKEKQRKQYIARVEKNLSLARNLMSEALSLEARSEYKAAFGRYDRVDEILGSIRSSLRQKFDFGKPDQVPEEFQDLHEQAESLLVRSYTQRANLYGVRSDVDNGLRWVNRALAINPTHSQARQLKNIFTKHILNRNLNFYGSPY